MWHGGKANDFGYCHGVSWDRWGGDDLRRASLFVSHVPYNFGELVCAVSITSDHLCCSILSLYLTSQAHFASSFNDAIIVILGFIETGWHSAHEFSGATLNEVVKLFDDFEMHESITHGLADTLLEVANKICNSHAGLVPQSKEGLKSIGLNEPLVSLLMQHVYASSELVITLDTRKVVVALDMVDWEEFGAKTKSAVLMSKVTPEKVRKACGRGCQREMECTSMTPWTRLAASYLPEL